MPCSLCCTKLVLSFESVDEIVNCVHSFPVSWLCLLCYTWYGIVLNLVRRPFKSTGVIPVLCLPGYHERCQITDLTSKFAGSIQIGTKLFSVTKDETIIQ